MKNNFAVDVVVVVFVVVVAVVVNFVVVFVVVVGGGGVISQKCIAKDLGILDFNCTLFIFHKATSGLQTRLFVHN